MCYVSFLLCPCTFCRLCELNTHPPGLPPHPPHPPFPLIFYFFYFSEVSHAAVLHFLLFSLLFPPYFKSCLFARLFAFCRTFISFLCSY